MASSRDVGGPRLVGRVVDPLAREDGADEPDLESEPPIDEPLLQRVSDPDPLEAEEAVEPPLDASASGAHPVRDRLLARAAAVRDARRVAQPPEQESTEEPLSPRSFDDELELIAAGRPRSRALGARHASVSPNMIALFGSLFGLATMASLFAVLVHIDPRDTEHPPQAVEPKTAAPAPKATSPAPQKPKRRRLPGPWRIADSNDARLKKLEGQVGRVPFLRAIQDAGLETRQAYRAYTAMKGLRDLDKCGQNDRFAALIDSSSGRLNAFEYIVTKEEVYQAREGADGLLKASKLDLKVERERVQGSILFDRDTFSASAEAAGFEEGLGNVLDDALEGHTNVSQFRKGDRLRVVAMEVTVLGEFSRYAGVEALEYLPANEGARPVRIYYVKSGRSRGYFDAQGRAPYQGGWRKPIKGAPITSRFNPKRMHPVLKKVMPHNGTDFGAPMGAPVGASAPGTVSYVGYAGPSGNLVLIQHANSYETGYAHLSRFEAGLKLGDRVDRLQVIGYVGSTGRSTGPHLHFSAKKNDKFIDPESLNLDALHVLPQGDREQFLPVKATYDKLLDAIALPKPLPAAPAAPGAEAASEGDFEMDAHEPELEEREAAATPPVQPVTTEAPRPLSKAPAAPQAPKPAGGSKASAIYLSDEDLLRSQSAVDDGEVEK